MKVCGRHQSVTNGGAIEMNVNDIPGAGEAEHLKGG